MGSAERLLRPTTDSTPSSRYASLHRTIEAGCVSERDWEDLLRVCLELDKSREALHAYRQLRSFGVRVRLHAMLVDHGVLQSDEERPWNVQIVTDASFRPTILERLRDGLEYVVEGCLPSLATRATIGFGLLLFLGGAAAQEVGAMGAMCLTLPLAFVLLGWAFTTVQGIVAVTVKGFDDPPEVLGFRAIASSLPRVLTDLCLASIICFAPVVLVRSFVDHWAVQVPLLAAAGTLSMTFLAIRWELGSWRHKGFAGALVVDRCSILLATLVNAIWFVPVAVVIHASTSQPLHLVLSYIGLLTVVPAIVASRVIGQSLRFADLGETYK